MLDLQSPVRLTPVTQARAVEQLRRLRREIEAHAGQLEQIELNAALMLADVCDALSFSEAERQTVLGARAKRFVDRLTRR